MYLALFTLFLERLFPTGYIFGCYSIWLMMYSFCWWDDILLSMFWTLPEHFINCLRFTFIYMSEQIIHMRILVSVSLFLSFVDSSSSSQIFRGECTCGRFSSSPFCSVLCVYSGILQLSILYPDKQLSANHTVCKLIQTFYFHFPFTLNR